MTNSTMVQLDLLESLPDRIASHAKLFDGMLQLIPTKYYITNKNQTNDNNPYMYNKRKNGETKELMKKAKKAKLNPENMKSITDIQKEQAEAAAAAAAAAEEEDGEEVEEDEEPEKAESDEDMEEDEEVAQEDEVASVAKSTTSDELASASVTDFSQIEATPMVRSDIAELHGRLQQRIADLRRKRNAPNSDSPKAQSRQEILAERQKKREERKKAIKAKKEKGNTGPAEEIVKPAPAKPKSATDGIKMDGDLFFSKVELGNDQKKKKGPTDAKTLLQKVEAKKERLDKLREENMDKAAELEEKEQWDKAVQLATGEKIRDDAKLLKKTIKRTEQRKKKSADEWRKRTEKVKEDEKRKIQKREENLRNRAAGGGKNKKKGGDSKKKGGDNKKKGGDNKKKARHGFEGAAFGFGGKAAKNKSKK